MFMMVITMMMAGKLYEPVFFGIAVALSYVIGAEFCLSPSDKERVLKPGGNAKELELGRNNKVLESGGGNIGLGRAGGKLDRDKRSMDIIAVVLAMALGVWLGMRPIYDSHFGDTYNYAIIYQLIPFQINETTIHSDWLWMMSMNMMNEWGVSVEMFILLIEIAYMGTTLWALRRLMPNHAMIGLAFVLSSLMFYSYGINGLRNGLACQMALLAMTYLNRRSLLGFLLIAFVSVNIHRSVAIPIVAALLGSVAIKNIKVAMALWCVALALSLLIGEAIEGLISTFDFDDRISLYTGDTIDKEQFTKVGFRWDFLIYSMAPLAMMIYIECSKCQTDRMYRILAVAYCLSNAAWLLVIRLPFSNRIGYLSWFLMPVVIAYPLVKFNLGQYQDKKLGGALIVYATLTMIIRSFMSGAYT